MVFFVQNEPPHQIFKGHEVAAMLKSELQKQKTDFLIFRALEINTVSEYLWGVGNESLPNAHSSRVIPAVLGLHFWFSGNKEIITFFHYHYHERVPTHCRASSPGSLGP